MSYQTDSGPAAVRITPTAILPSDAATGTDSDEEDGSADADNARRPRDRVHREAAYLFKYIIMTQIVVYIEAGAIPSLLNQLKVIFSMSFAELGSLGGIVYLFLSLACPLAGYCFRRYNIRTVMAVSLFLNMCAVLLFALTPDGYTNILIGSRALIGFTQAFLMVYSPVWVDEFAPDGARTKWMSYLQGAVPIGIMMGYCFATVISYFDACPWCDHIICECWRWPFLMQVLIQFPLVFGSFFVPEEHIDARAHLVRGDDFSRHLPKELPHGVSNRLNAAFMYDPSPAVHPAMPMDETFSETVTPANATAAVSTTSAATRSAFDFTPTDSARAAAALATATAPVTLSSSSSGGGSLQSNPLQLPSAVPTTGVAAPVRTGSLLHVARSSSTAGAAQSTSTGADSSSKRFGRQRDAIQHERDSYQTNRSGGFGFDDDSDASHSGTGCCDQLMSTLTALIGLFSNRVYTYVALALSALYFVVTGVQFWGTDYLISVLGGDMHTVRLLFIFTSATAPIAGVLFGGWVVDRAGGYSGMHQMVIALRCCIVFGIAGAGMAVPCAYFTSLYPVFAMMWTFLFFGGAVVPPATGVLISCVPPHMRAFASGVSVVFFNLLGYFLCPMLSGLVMGKLGEYMPPLQAFQWGFRCILFWTGWAFLFLVLAWIDAEQNQTQRETKSRNRNRHRTINEKSYLSVQQSDDSEAVSKPVTSSA